MVPHISFTPIPLALRQRLLTCMKHSSMVRSSMFRLSFLAEGFHGRHLHLEEVLLFMIILKHADLRLAATEQDRPRPIMDPLLPEDTDLHPLPEEAHRQGGMEVVQVQEIVISTLIGRAHSPDQDRGDHAQGPILPDRGPGLSHVEAAPMDVEIALRPQEVVGEEGVLATLAFPAIAIGAVAEVEFGTAAVGVSLRGLSRLMRLSMVATNALPYIRDVLAGHERQYGRFDRCGTYLA